MLNTHNQLLLETYKEQATSSKHEDNILHRFTAVVLPLSIAALGLPYLEPKIPEFLATIGGLTLMTFWAVSCQILQSKYKVRISIINQIEAHWEIMGHEEFTKRRGEIYGKKLSSHFLRCCMFWAYLGIVGMRTLYRLYILCFPHDILITQIIDPLVIVALAVVAAVIVGWAMREAKKEVLHER